MIHPQHQLGYGDVRGRTGNGKHRCPATQPGPGEAEAGPEPLTDDDLVLGTLEGRPRLLDAVTKVWETVAAHVGVKVIRFHDARRAHASIMLKQGNYPKIVQERLGYASIAITPDTSSLVAPDLREAAAARFDNVMTPNRANQAVAEVGWRYAGNAGFGRIGRSRNCVENWGKCGHCIHLFCMPE